MVPFRGLRGHELYVVTTAIQKVVSRMGQVGPPSLPPSLPLLIHPCVCLSVCLLACLCLSAQATYVAANGTVLSMPPGLVALLAAAFSTKEPIVLHKKPRPGGGDTSEWVGG